VAALEWRYARALWRAAPASDLLRAGWRRVRDRVRRLPPAPPSTPEQARRAADALTHAPRLFTRDDMRALYARFPDGAARLRARGEQILRREIEVFGQRAGAFDWRIDPDAPGADPKRAWELARGAHLVELAAAARLHPDLAAPARAEIAATLDDFIRENPLGEGLHFASPLEIAVRGVHWLAALELAGVTWFPRTFLERLAGFLRAETFFLAARLEDGGVCPANHLLGDAVGLLTRGLALDEPRFTAEGVLRVRDEAARQVGPDGAHFEGSTAYHRFALELLLVAHLASAGAGLALGLAPTLVRMLCAVRATLAPDGSEPGFGDGDDARLLPIVPRAPRDHAYLLPVGVALFGADGLRRAGAPPSEEALWLGGGAGLARWDAAAPTPDPPSVSLPTGGVHVLRSPRWFVAMRSGGYGQHGVGGHAHNDQLSLVVFADGAPLIADPGTGSYTADPVVRDRFRGTAAHATLIVDGEEQSPLFEARPFALPDGAQAPPVRLEDLGAAATLEGAHHGYRRLRARAIHRRRVTLDRALDVLVVEDTLEGRGTVAVELRFPVAEAAQIGASAALRARAAALARRLPPLDLDRAVELGGRIAIVPLVGCSLEPALCHGWFSPRFGRILQRDLVSFAGLLSLPMKAAVAFLRIDP
jgi:hypothetical protein